MRSRIVFVRAAWSSAGVGFRGADAAEAASETGGAGEVGGAARVVRGRRFWLTGRNVRGRRGEERLRRLSR